MSRLRIYSARRRSTLAALLAGFCLPALVALLGGSATSTRTCQAAAAPKSRTEEKGGESSAPADLKRAREGSRLTGEQGTFKVAGDGLVFVTASGGRSFTCLENLALERIGQAVGESPDVLDWSVTGVITEYRGANYLLLTQVTIKPKPTRLPRKEPAAKTAVLQ